MFTKYDALKTSLASLLFALACHAVAQSLPQKPAPATPAPLPRDMTPQIRVLVAAEEESVLSAQMGGRIGNIAVGIGQSFGRGQRLLSFDCAEQAARLRMAEAELHGARETYDSKLKLRALQSVSDLELSQAGAALDRAKAQADMTRAQVAYCSVSAPFAGRVVRLRVKPFESVNVGQPLIEIVNPARLKANLHVPSRWLAWLKPGAAFDVHIEETARTYKARVTSVNGRVDAVSQTVELEASFEGAPPELLAGMSGRAEFPQTLREHR